MSLLEHVRRRKRPDGDWIDAARFDQLTGLPLVAVPHTNERVADVQIEARWIVRACWIDIHEVGGEVGIDGS